MWRKSSFSAETNSVWVDADDQWVRYGRGEGDEQGLRMPAWQFRELLKRVRAGEHINWTGVFFPLDYSEGEIDAFVEGVLAGEFDLPFGEESPSVT